MHILTGIIALIGVVGVLLWRINSAAEAAKGIGETAGEVKGLFRRAAWRRKANVDLLAAVDDPRLAAVAMMVAVAQSDGAMTQAENTTILRKCVEVLGADGKLAEDLLAHARWLVRDVHDVDEALRRLTPAVRRGCDREQRAQVIAMLDQVAAASGAPGGMERRAIERLTRNLRE